MASLHSSAAPAVPAAAPLIRGGRLLPCTLAALLGLILLAGVGFSPLPAMHNATHDSRHALGFPCH